MLTTSRTREFLSRFAEGDRNPGTECLAKSHKVVEGVGERAPIAGVGNRDQPRVYESRGLVRNLGDGSASNWPTVRLVQVDDSGRGRLTDCKGVKELWAISFS